MSRLKASIRAIFGFNRTQTNAFIILLPLMFVIILAPAIARKIVSSRTDDFTYEAHVLDSISRQLVFPDKQRKSTPAKPNASTKRFLFDPNTATRQDLLTLGFIEPTITTLLHYREKGGKFRIKRDLLKVYGIDSAQFNSLEPLIALPASNEPKSHLTETRPNGTSAIAAIDINLADTTQLKAVYGIGSKLSGRIIKYRERLGGFVKLEQLYEVYGLDSAIVSQLKTQFFVNVKFEPIRININTLTGNEKPLHPYLDYKLAKAIATYRFQHGEYNSIDDLRPIQLLTADKANKLLPYLTTQ